MSENDKIAMLEARIEELERKANPPAPLKFEAGPRGPTTTEIGLRNAKMGREATEKMAIPGVRDIFRDARVTQNLAPLSDAAARPRAAQENRSGWANEVPLSPPPGISLIDRMVEVQTARDTAELIASEARRLTSAKK
jgi:hypothetical protein